MFIIRLLGLTMHRKKNYPNIHQLKHGKILSNGGIAFVVKEIKQSITEENKRCKNGDGFT